MHQGILLTVDYHDQNCVIRRRNAGTGEERVVSVPTTEGDLRQVVAQARVEVGRRGRIVWLQESTTGWARVQAALGDQVEFLLANVLQMPRPPKAHRRKTDKVDTARLQREYGNGNLPLAHQPPAWWRQVRRIVACRENLVSRRTALRNWINRYLAHETWADRSGLWSAKGLRRLKALVAELPRRDGLVVSAKLAELEHLGQAVAAVEAELLQVYHECPDAQRVDAVRGIGVTAAVSIVARIGPVSRFGDAEQLIAFAGLAPGVQQSDQTRRDGRIGGGGTDKHLRHYLIEASVWARHVERYRGTYTRTVQRRGVKIGRLVVARMLLRSIYKVLKDGVAFQPAAAAEGG
jgi:transposase